MTEMQDIDAAGGAQEEVLPNYTGAIYGSLLAASVVVGAAGDTGTRPLLLAALLLATGVVFWLAHAYSRLVGERIQHLVVNPREIRRVGRAGTGSEVIAGHPHGRRTGERLGRSV